MPNESDIVTNIQNLVNATERVAKNILSVFPSITASSSSGPATAGAITFGSSLAAGFILVTTSSGATVKVPFYNQ